MHLLITLAAIVFVLVLFLAVGYAWWLRRPDDDLPTVRLQPDPGPTEPPAAAALVSLVLDLPTAAVGGAGQWLLAPPGPYVLGRGRQATVPVVELPGLGYEAVMTVSRAHAQLAWERGAWVLRDLDSRNDVWVDGQRSGVNRLRPGCRVHRGQVSLRFQPAQAA
ncbi:MAG: FHA domain-containing protein [Chloroflexi bacterium]|nr:FHA domain-containing protein [Chloroflexota bacterium]